jgi:hypothetical protein
MSKASSEISADPGSPQKYTWPGNQLDERSLLNHRNDVLAFLNQKPDFKRHNK